MADRQKTDATRSAADATRFTASRPVVFSKGNTIDISRIAGPAPPGESPAQKVQRLREAARRAKAEQETQADKYVRIGRRVADVAHKGFVSILLGATVIGSGFAFFALYDMIAYNRRKRAEYIVEQEFNYQMALKRAIQAEAAGTLTPDLALVLNKERAVQEYDRIMEERAQRNMVQKMTDFITGDAPRIENPGGAMGFANDEIKRIAEGRTRTEHEVIPHPASESRPEVMVKEAAGLRAAGNTLPPAAGGMLDQMAQKISDDTQKASRSWYDWILRKR